MNVINLCYLRDSVTRNVCQIGTQTYRIWLNWYLRSGFRFFWVSVASTQFFKDNVQEGKAEKQLNCTRAHRSHGKIGKIRYLQLMKSSGCRNAPIRDEKAKYSTPAVQSTPGVPHTEVQIPSLQMCAALQQYPNRAPRRFTYAPEVHLHMDEAHNGLVLNLRCALRQVIFLSVFTSFE